MPTTKSRRSLFSQNRALWASLLFRISRCSGYPAVSHEIHKKWPSRIAKCDCTFVFLPLEGFLYKWLWPNGEQRNSKKAGQRLWNTMNSVEEHAKQTAYFERRGWRNGLLPKLSSQRAVHTLSLDQSFSLAGPSPVGPHNRDRLVGLIFTIGLDLTLTVPAGLVRSIRNLVNRTWCTGRLSLYNFIASPNY